MLTQNMLCRIPKGSLTLPYTGSCKGKKKVFLPKCPDSILSFSLIPLRISKKHQCSISSQKTFQVSLSGCLRHKDLADYFVCRSSMPIYLLHNLQGLALFPRVKSSLKLPCKYHRMRIQTWADPGKQMATVTYRGDVNRREGEMGLRDRGFSLVGCDGDSQTRSALCSATFLWIT